MTCWYHSTPSKLCDACMREQAKAAPAAPAVPDWADMGDAAEVHSRAAIDFAMLDFSGDAKWEQRAAEFTAEKQRDGWLKPEARTFARALEEESAVSALCGFAARMATPSTRGNALAGDWGYLGKILYPNLEELHRWSAVSDATDALRYALDNPGPDAKPMHQVMADWAPSGPAKDALFFGVERARTFRLGAPGCHVGATVRHRGDPASGLMKVTAINGAVDRVCCVDANGDKREFGLSSGWLVLVDGSGR